MPRTLKILVLAFASLIMLAAWKGLDALLRPTSGRRVAWTQGDTQMARKIKKPAKASASKSETAVFAAGCFWGVEYKFREINGVKDTEVGYTGGMTENPDYGHVCTDRTGHAEAVRVTFDPSIVSYEDLVRFFFAIHDPTQVDGQGPDVGTQYRSEIFIADETQKETAQKVMDELQASGRFTKPIATGIVPASKFTRAEEYHQRYYEKNKKKACAF